MSHELSSLNTLSFDSLDPQACLRKLLKRHHQGRTASVDNLLASDSFMSDQTLALLADPIARHSAAGHIGQHNRMFAGSGGIDDIDSLCHYLCQTLFQANACEHRILGGTQANMILYLALLKPGDRIASVSPQHGGDSSTHDQSILGRLDIIIDDIPFHPDLSIDFDRLEQQFIKHRYRLLSLGFSVSLIQADYKRLITLCQRYDVICHIDCAHELGLIAAGLVDNPLNLGADIVSASTGKAFAGPPGGLLLWQDKRFSQRLIDRTFPECVGGYQNNRVAALCQTFIEYLLGQKNYLSRALLLTNPLARALEQRNIKVCRYGSIASQTHHLMIDCRPYHARKVMQQLEQNEVLTSLANIPLSHQVGLRISTIQPAMRGYQEREIKQLAEKFAQTFADLDDK